MPIPQLRSADTTLRRTAISAQLIIALLALGLVSCNRKMDLNISSRSEDSISAQAKELAAEQTENDQRIWADELTALRHEWVLVQLWDAFRLQPEERFRLLREMPFENIHIGEASAVKTRDWETSVTEIVPVGSEELNVWTHDDWQKFLDLKQSEGFELLQMECRQTRFFPGEPNRSEFWVEFHVANPTTLHSQTLNGFIVITWDPALPGTADPRVNSIDASQLTLTERIGEPMFNQVKRFAVERQEEAQAVTLAPIIIHDLTGDGVPEIILGGLNTVLHRTEGFDYSTEELFAEPLTLSDSAVVADFTGEGFPDFLGIQSDGEAILIPGDSEGRFTGVPITPWTNLLEAPGAIAVGDIDADGNLDVWVTQQRSPYVGGRLPQPFENAHDGPPAYLMHNNGDGTFNDNSLRAGLAESQRRRISSSSFIDIDRDGHLDLLIVSDYGATEIYQNNGYGFFENQTALFLDEARVFGRSHTFGHFDRDGILDLFVGGRWSTAAHRINAMDLGRPDFPHYRELSEIMGSGNRLYLSSYGYRLTLTNPLTANTGWSAGVTAVDFDNDADDDLYIATGYRSGLSALDFDSQYWRHDVFLNEEIDPKVLDRLFNDPELSPQLQSLRDGRISWYGHQFNRLLMNEGDGFLDLGFLHNLSLQRDCPATLATDLDLDGKIDLLVLAQDSVIDKGKVLPEQSLLIYQNRLETKNHWVGVQLDPHGEGFHGIGARVTIHGSFGIRERTVVTGESSLTQQPTNVHFGLGSFSAVDHIEISWSNGHRQVVDGTEIDRYHRVIPSLDLTPAPEPEPTPEPVEEDAEAGNDVKEDAD